MFLVDDILIISSDERIIKTTKNMLNKFNMEDMSLAYRLGNLG